jgi:hypothetical protein
MGIAWPDNAGRLTFNRRSIYRIRRVIVDRDRTRSSRQKKDLGFPNNLHHVPMTVRPQMVTRIPGVRGYHISDFVMKWKKNTNNINNNDNK